MTIVTNSWGTHLDFDVTVHYMDDELREELHRELAPCSEQEFFDAYCKAHLERFGEDFSLDEKNPAY